MGMRNALCFAAWFFSTCLWAGDPSWAPTLQKGSGEDLVLAYTSLTRSLGPKGARTEGFTLQRPALKVELGPGVFFSEVSPTPLFRGFYYEGSAKVSFSVSDPVERAHLKLFLGREALEDQPVKSLYILPLGDCPDIPTLEGESAPQAPGDYQRFKNALRVQGLKTLGSVLNRPAQGKDALMVLFQIEGSVWCYRLDHLAEEEVALCRLGNPPHREAWWWDAAVSLHLLPSGALTRNQTRPEVEAKFVADALREEVDFKLDGDGDALPGSTARLSLRLLKPARALALHCSTLVDLSKVTSGGTELQFIKEEYTRRAFYSEDRVLVLLPEGARGDLELTFSYSGDFMENSYGFYAIRDEAGWLPTLRDADGWTFSFRADVPKGFEAVSVGDLSQPGAPAGPDREVFAYEMKEPVRLATYLFGKFKHTKTASEGIEVDLCLPDNAQTLYINQNRKTIAAEIAAAVKVYTRLFGPIPYKVLRVGLTGSYVNMGFPTLVLLSWDVLGREDTSSWPEQIVAHEVAHQWWGNGAEPMTYRDAWVSESLAEFASYVCLRETKGMDTMKKYLSHDFHTFTKLSDVLKKPYVDFGPICLGNRLFTTLDADSAYQTVVYYKGAWTLLTLTRMAGFSPAGEAGFYDGLKAFLAGARGKLVGTADLREALERSMKVKLDWFFTQWLESSVIPKVKVKTTVTSEGGTHKLAVEGTQDSSLTLPIPVQAAQGKTVREFLFFLKPGGSRSEFPLPFKPDKVVVDTNRICLADYQ